MFDLSPLKVMIVVTVVLILLGPDKLPEVSRKLGSTWRAIKQLQEKVETEVREVIPQLPNSGDLSRIVRSPIGLLNHLADRAEMDDDTESEYLANDGVNSVQPLFGSIVSNNSPLEFVTESLPTTDPSLN